MALNKSLLMTDSGGGSAYSSAIDWNSLINSTPTPNTGRTKISGALSDIIATQPAYTTPSYNYLPEAEVKENTSNDTGSKGWFTQSQAAAENKSNYPSQTPTQQVSETSNYNGYYGSYPTNSYQNVSDQSIQRQSNYTPQQTVQQKPTYNQVAPVEEKTLPSVQSQNDNIINSLLQQSAAEDNSKLNTSLPVVPVEGLSNYDAIRFGIQQAIEQANAVNEASPSANVNDEQSILDWNWRSGQLQLPQNYKATDSNSGTNIQQYTPAAQQLTRVTPNRASESLPQTSEASPSILDSIMNLGVKSASAAADIPVDYAGVPANTQAKPSWKDNFQLNAPILSGTDIADFATTPEKSAQTSQATISPQQLGQLLNDPLARQFYAAAKADGETDTNAGLFALKQTNYLNENPRQSLSDVIKNNVQNARDTLRQAKEKTAGLGTLYGNYLSNPNDSIERFAENGGWDKAAQLNANLKNMRVQSENQNRIRKTAVDLAKADGQDFYNLPMEQQEKYENIAEGQTKLVSETTPEYQRQLIQNRIDSDNNKRKEVQSDLEGLIGYSNNETGSQKLSKRNYEPIIKESDLSVYGSNNSNTSNNTNNANASVGLDGLIKGPNDYDLQIALKNGDTTYRQIYDNYVNDHIQNLYDRYIGAGYDEATAREAAIQNSRSQAFQKIYGLGFRFDPNNLDDIQYYSQNLDGSYVNGDFINGLESGINNNYITNNASYDDRLLNMAAGHIDGRNERTLDDLMLYNEAPKITDSSNSNNWQGWNSAMQAAMSGLLTKEEILHLYDSDNANIVIPESAKKFFTDPAHAMQQLYLNNGKNASNAQSVDATLEEYQKAIQDLLNANPELKMMVDNGILTTDDLAMNFFKNVNLSDNNDNDLESKYKSYGSGGGGYSSGYSRSYGSGGGGSYGGYGSSGGSSASTKNQDETRIHNIMKNWTF